MSKQLRQAARSVVDHYVTAVAARGAPRRTVDFQMSTLIDALHRELAVDSDRDELAEAIRAARGTTQS